MLQAYGVIAAISHIGFNWDAYMRAIGRTKPIAVASAASMATFLLLGIPLLLKYGLSGLAAAVALQTVANIVCRAYYLSQLFEGFTYLSHAMRAILPTVPAVAAVFAMRAVETGHRTFLLAVTELSVYLLVTGIATWFTDA